MPRLFTTWIKLRVLARVSEERQSEHQPTSICTPFAYDSLYRAQMGARRNASRRPRAQAAQHHRRQRLTNHHVMPHTADTHRRASPARANANTFRAWHAGCSDTTWARRRLRKIGRAHV